PRFPVAALVPRERQTPDSVPRTAGGPVEEQELSIRRPTRRAVHSGIFVQHFLRTFAVGGLAEQFPLSTLVVPHQGRAIRGPDGLTIGPGIERKARPEIPCDV